MTKTDLTESLPKQHKESNLLVILWPSGRHIFHQPLSHRKLVDFHCLTHFTRQCLWLTQVYSSQKERVLKGEKKQGGKVGQHHNATTACCWVTNAWTWTRAFTFTLLTAPKKKSKNHWLWKPQRPKSHEKHESCRNDRQTWYTVRTLKWECNSKCLWRMFSSGMRALSIGYTTCRLSHCPHQPHTHTKITVSFKLTVLWDHGF